MDSDDPFERLVKKLTEKKIELLNKEDERVQQTDKQKKLQHSNNQRRGPREQNFKKTKNEAYKQFKEEEPKIKEPQKKYVSKHTTQQEKPKPKKKYIDKTTLNDKEEQIKPFGKKIPQKKPQLDDMMEEPVIISSFKFNKNNIIDLKKENFTIGKNYAKQEDKWPKRPEQSKISKQQWFNRPIQESLLQQQPQRKPWSRNHYKQHNNTEETKDTKHQNQRSQTTFNKPPRTLEYKNQCQIYLQSKQKLNQNEEQIGVQIKKLKKYFLGSELVQTYKSKPSNISVYKCLDKPTIFFEYNYQGETRYMKLKGVEKGLGHKLGQFYEIVRKIYDLHYYQIDVQYQNAIIQFAKLKAKDINVNIALSRKKFNHFTEKKEFKNTQKMIYYCLNRQNYISIVVFDYMMRDFQFAQKFIDSKKELVSKETYEIVEKWRKQVKGGDVELVNLGQEEVQSEHQEEEQQPWKKWADVDEEEQLENIAERLKQLLATDLRHFKEQMEEKNEEFYALHENQNAKDGQLEILGDFVDKRNRDIQNFEMIKRQIEAQIRQHKKKNQSLQKQINFSKLSCKRLILAKKQLQSDLPILGKKNEIFDMLKVKNLLIIEGETGSGKSTQLPQLLCEYYRLFSDPGVKPVLITQPRKIATRSLAQRVADELEEKCGDFVDYVASGTKTANPKAKIVFKLDRLVLDELVESPTLDEYSCLVIDEAHERTISIDVILGLVKELLQKRKNFKVIITSASMEISLFEKYFNTKTLKVSGRMFPVNVQYLPSKEQDTVKKIEKAIDNELLTERNMLKDKYKGHILVFCADTSEIEALTEIFKRKLNHNVFMVIPLHGKLTPEEQRKAFSKTKEHKLIFASRIAETAITIDGVKVVIDPGWDREMQYDQKTKFSSMKLVEISQSSAKQRAGRAGRTQEGYCLRLYSEQQFRNRRINKLPQIKNIALDTLVLRLKILGIEDVTKFDYIEKPNQQGMKASIQVLKMIGCLDKTQKITAIGSFLVKIPIQPFLSRAIVEAILMEKTLKLKQNQNLDKKYSEFTQPVIQILCMVLNAGNLFRISENYRQLGQAIKYQHFAHEKGDFFFLKTIYDQYKLICDYNKFQLNPWIHKNFLIRKTLFQVEDLVKEIKLIIKQFDRELNQRQMKDQFKKCRYKLEKYTKEEDRILACLTTSFAANLCIYSGHPQIGYTYMNLEKIVTIYGTSCLSLMGICPKWILAYDFYENKEGKLYCKVGNQITSDFLKNTVQEYVFNKYQIDKVDKINPYYKQTHYNLQTLLLTQLKQAYVVRQYRKQKQTQFLKHLDLNFSEAQNKVTVFIRCEQKKQPQKLQQQLQLENYIENLRKKAQDKIQHNYIGNIFVTIGNGFQIENIQFKNTQTVFEISGIDGDIVNMIENDWGNTAFVETFGGNKIKIYLDDEETISYFHNYVEFLTSKEQKKILLRKEISDKRKKIPQTKIYLHWFAGTSQRGNILLNFGKRIVDPTKEELKQLISETQSQMRYLDQARLAIIEKIKRRIRAQGLYLVQPQLSEQDEQLYRKARQISGVQMTKNGLGVNIYSSLDEIQLHRFFNDLIKTNNINLAFQMPKYTKKFREPQLPQCGYKDSQWIQKIQNLIEPLINKKENCIRVWGYGIRPKKNQVLTEFQKTFRIQMKAEIKTFDSNLIQKLKKKYDGKVGILGCEKIHVTSVFSQSVVSVDWKVFQSLRDQFDYNVDLFYTQYPNLSVDFNVRQVRRNDKKSKVFITISSQKRQDLLRPVQTLNNLFTPKYITLTDTQYRFLINTEGDKLLEDIQIQYDYKIYFGFDKYQRRIKLYCHDSVESDIRKMVKYRLSLIQYFDESISYKGRNLKKVQQILKEKQNEIDDFNEKSRYQQRFLSYEIRFTYRKINITADIKSFNEVKNQIMNIQILQTDQDCSICGALLITPYRLFNCKHTFCYFCLANTIKQFKLGQTPDLRCCYITNHDDKICNQFINIHDISKILSEQQLQQIFDVKISKYVDAHPDKYVRCFSPNCEQIFQREILKEEKQIDCELCGKHYCIQCKESHKNYTCKEWQQRFNLTEDKLKQMGVKKCPKCGNGIERNGGCLHMTCKCGAHVCWVCLALFSNSKQCYDHLAKVHKGIFDPQNM